MQSLLLSASLEPVMRSISLDSVLIAVVLLAGVVFFTLRHKGALSPLVFYGFSTVALVTTTVLFMTTLILQINSDSYGKAHRQAEIEFWACETELYPTIHQQDGHTPFSLRDKRVYVSGFIHNAQNDATLGTFMQSIGGDIQSDSVVLPLHTEPEQWRMPDHLRDGDPQGTMSTTYMERFVVEQSSDKPLFSATNAQNCPSNTEAELQVFVYSFDSSSKTYTQRKITSPEDYIFTTGRSVPPADCIIVEFSRSKQYTDKLCPSYGIRDSQRCSAFGINRTTENFCSYQEIREQEGEL